MAQGRETIPADGDAFMADAAEEILGEDELTAGLEKKKLSGKKLIVLAGGAVVLLGVVATLLLSGGDKKSVEPGVDEKLDDLAQEEVARQRQQQLEEEVPLEKLELLFVKLDPRVYNLNTGGDGSSFLNVTITLEVDRESYSNDLKVKMPRILDEFNLFLRELRPSDLEGAAGIYRLKEELLRRVNQSVAPTRVKDILFEQFLIQGS